MSQEVLFLAIFDKLSTPPWPLFTSPCLLFTPQYVFFTPLWRLPALIASELIPQCLLPTASFNAVKHSLTFLPTFYRKVSLSFFCGKLHTTIHELFMYCAIMRVEVWYVQIICTAYDTCVNDWFILASTRIKHPIHLSAREFGSVGFYHRKSEMIERFMSVIHSFRKPIVWTQFAMIHNRFILFHPFHCYPSICTIIH